MNKLINKNTGRGEELILRERRKEDWAGDGRLREERRGERGEEEGALKG
uniref:Uncharacterized protein n=1 Tax=Anguilla anguilla TaxID=7936 RepID=A0A0E9SLL6_ANGAN